MIKIFVILLVALATAHADDVPERAIRTAEQALTRFQQARDGELKTSIKESSLRTIMSYVGRSAYLRVEVFSPSAYLPPHHDPVDDDRDRILGTYANVSGCKNETWLINYYGGGIDSGGMMVYLDASTGKILYICRYIEG